jgi:hypothetical protein
MGTDINAFLRDALANKGKVEIGQFQLLNLDVIKDRLGENWPSMRGKIFDAAAHFIEKRIGGDDVFISCEEGFLIIFTDKEIDARSEISEIGEELQRFFLGSAETEDIKVAGEVKSVDAQELATISKSSTPTAQAETDPFPRTAAVPASSRPVATARPAPKPIPEQRVAPAFAPIWDSERQAISSNIAFGKAKTGGRLLDGRRVIETRMRTDISHFELDMSSVRGAMSGLMGIIKKKRKASFCLTPHVTTFADETTRTEYLACLESLPPPVLKAFTLRIDDLPIDDLASLELLEFVREAGLNIMLELPFGTEDLSPYEHFGISIFSCTKPPSSNANTEGLLDPDLRALNSLAHSARALRATTHLGDVRDLRTLKAAMASGIRMFSGKSVVPDNHAPSQTRPLSMVDLYRLNKAA